MPDGSVTGLVLSRIRDIPDFPQPGVLFKDFTPLLADAEAFAAVVHDVAGRYAGPVDVVVGIEARGFIIGAAVAHRPRRRRSSRCARRASCPVRRCARSTPSSTAPPSSRCTTSALQPGQRVLVVDDVLATGGTVAATCRLVERAGATVTGIDVVLELTFLGGREQVGDRPLYAIAPL